MTVKELRELLMSLPDDTEIILSIDAEGNAFHPLETATPGCIYIEGEILDDDWDNEEAGMSQDEWEDLKANNPRCIVLWPTN